MATSNLEIGGLKPFDVHSDPNSLALEWKRWLRSFQLYADGKGLIITPDKDDNKIQRRALLLHSAGPDVQDIFYVLPDTGGPKEYAKAEQALNNYFVTQVNIPYERHQFREMTQKEEETIDQYVVRLKRKTEACNYGNQTNDQIRDQIISTCRSNELRRKLLEKGQTLTLKELQDIARTFEAVKRQSKSMCNPQDQGPSHVNWVGKKPAKDKGTGQPSRPKEKKEEGKPSYGVCYRCGRQGHFAKDVKCPARNKECHKCKQTGHFANCCKTKSQQNTSNQKGKDVRQVTEQADYPFTVTTTDKEIPKIDIVIGGVQLEGVLLDSGSTCNVIDKETWEELKRERIICKAKKSDRKLFAYGSKKPLSTIGEFEAELCYKNKTITVVFVVVEEKAIPILSRETCEELGALKIVINSVDEQSSIFSEFKECFEGVGKLRDFKAKLHIDDSVKPVAQRQRPVPFGVRQKVEEKLEELVNADIIEPVTGPTPWVSPVVVVPKKGDEIRLCVDMRKANEAIVRERHPIPSVDEILYNLNGSKVFSKLDLKWGFHQIELDEDSRDITTFVTHKGLYRYKRLMFGISSAPELYNHIIRQVLAGCEGADNIYDDIIVYGSSVEEHDRRLQETLNCIRDNGLTLNREKCNFRMSELTFMGYLLSERGIGPTESRIEAIVNAREPQDAEEVRSFLGLVNFSARFIPDLATTAEPLRSLTRKGTPFKWGKAQQEAFDALKDTLASSSTLAYFDRDAEETKLITDASPVGLGAVLTQVTNGTERVIAYASRSLTDVEQRYSQTEKEALGIVWGCERFHMYLYGVEFTLLTDHKPLEMIYAAKTTAAPARIERWVLRLQPYKFTVNYIPGKQNIADSLSRLTNIKGHCIDKDTEEYIRHVVAAATPIAMSIQEIEEESASDPEMSQLRRCILTGEWDDIPSQYKAVRNELSTLGKLVLRGTRLVIPTKLRKRVLSLAHEGHQGIVKTKQRLRSKVWWAGMDREVEDKCKVCEGCQLVAQPSPPEPLKSTPFPKEPWQDLAADLMGPLPSGEYVFVVVDYYSRYFEVDILKSTTAPKIIESLDKIFCTYGLPVTLKTDNGPQFVSEQFTSYLAENGVVHKTSTPLWPQANGEVERQNRSLLKVLKIAHAEGKNMHAELRKFLMAYRTTPHSSTGSTPSKLLFNREMRSKLPELTETLPAYSEARDKDAENKQKRADYADTRRRARESDIVPGDTVLLKQRKENKLSTTFGKTPYEVTSKSGSEVVVTNPVGGSYRRNVTEIKKFFKEGNGEDPVKAQPSFGSSEVQQENSSTGTSTGTADSEPRGSNQNVSSTPPRPKRERRPPEYLKDYQL